MAEKKSRGKFLVYGLLVLVLFLVMVPIIFSFKGKLIRAEILVFLFLMLLALVSLIGYNKRWGERVLFFVFLISLGNVVFIWFFNGKLFMLPLFLGLVGVLMSLPKKEERREAAEEPYSEVLEEEKGEVPPPPAAESKSEKKVMPERKVTYTPGKYVASRMGSVYHEPSCDWAKKIAAGRRVWFEDKKEANQKGYKKHKCVS